MSVQILGPACTEGPSGAVRSAHELKIELSGPCSPHKNPLNTNNLINREHTQQNPTVTLKRILQINSLNTREIFYDGLIFNLNVVLMDIA